MEILFGFAGIEELPSGHVRFWQKFIEIYASQMRIILTQDALAKQIGERALAEFSLKKRKAA